MIVGIVDRNGDVLFQNNSETAVIALQIPIDSARAVLRDVRNEISMKQVTLYEYDDYSLVLPGFDWFE